MPILVTPARAWVLTTLAILPLTGCREQAPGTTVVALVDMSGSIPKETTDFYSSTLTTFVWERLTSRDRLIVLPVDSEAESQSEPLFSVDLARTQFSDPKDGFAHKQERERTRMRDFILNKTPLIKESLSSAAVRRTSNRGGTDIVGALHAAATAFPRTSDRRVLLILSDMIQESRELNVKQLSRTGERGAEQLVMQLATKRRIPSLRGVSVLVVGAGETGAGADNAGFFRSVRTFWKAFFLEAGATLDDRHYGYRTQDAIPEVLSANR